MRLTRKAGEKLFVDYAGLTMAYFCQAAGEMREASVFVATLGASSYTYAEAQESPGHEIVDWRTCACV